MRSDEQNHCKKLKIRVDFADEAVALGGTRARIGLLATFAPTLTSMPPEFAVAAPGTTVVPCLAEGSLAALDRGDFAEHDRLAAIAASRLKDCDIIALGQFSLARAASLVAEATGRPVLTTPDSAVRKLQTLLGVAPGKPALH